MKSLRFRLSIWFGASFLVVTTLFLAIACPLIKTPGWVWAKRSLVNYYKT